MELPTVVWVFSLKLTIRQLLTDIPKGHPVAFPGWFLAVSSWQLTLTSMVSVKKFFFPPKSLNSNIKGKKRNKKGLYKMSLHLRRLFNLITSMLKLEDKIYSARIFSTLLYYCSMSTDLSIPRNLNDDYSKNKWAQ